MRRDLEDAVRENNPTVQRNSSSPLSAGADGDAFTKPIGLYPSDNNGAGCEYLGDDMFPTAGENVTNAMVYGSSNPTTIFMKFEAHENESHAVRWSPVERLVATGGADRKVKLWDVGKGKCSTRDGIRELKVIKIKSQRSMRR